jgi:hypothetical protein
MWVHPKAQWFFWGQRITLIGLSHKKNLDAFNNPKIKAFFNNVRLR